jgi:hypothetical protein
LALQCKELLATTLLCHHQTHELGWAGHIIIFKDQVVVLRAVDGFIITIGLLYKKTSTLISSPHPKVTKIGGLLLLSEASSFVERSLWDVE